MQTAPFWPRKIGFDQQRMLAADRTCALQRWDFAISHHCSRGIVRLSDA
jgi:hypothetical protein